MPSARRSSRPPRRRRRRLHHVALLLQQEPASPAAALALNGRLSPSIRSSRAYSAGLLALRYGKIEAASTAREAIRHQAVEEAPAAGSPWSRKRYRRPTGVDSVLKNNPDGNEVRLVYAAC